MKYEQFIETLKSIPNLGWQLISGGIRTAEEVCPICAVANHVLETDEYETNYRKAATDIELGEKLAEDISTASDWEEIAAHDTDDDHEYEAFHKIRPQLLEATGLKS